MIQNKLFRLTTRAACVLGMLAGVSGSVHAAGFTAGKLAVLQLGTGGTNQGNTPDDIFFSRQNPYFVDQFEPNVANQTVPTYQVSIPTNGPTSIWANGNAGTEGNLALSADKSVLTFGGYCGDICSIVAPAGSAPLAPSNIAYDRGIGQVDAFGNFTQPYRGPSWYGVAQGKTNPRGTVTDGAGHYWGCGNGLGSLYFDAGSPGDPPAQIQVTCLTSCAKIINGTLYSSVKSGETGGLPIGIYSFVHNDLTPFPLPDVLSFPQLEIATDPINNKNPIGFDIDPTGTKAYVADNKNGIFKYVKNGLNWQLAYWLKIPGYNNWNTGIQTNAASVGDLVGTFSLTVDWSGATPVVYATTADSPGSDPRDAKKGSLVYYANRVIRIDDTNLVTSGVAITVTTNMNILKTIVQAPVYDPATIVNGSLPHLFIVYKSVTFTPDLSPAITANPLSWSAMVGDNVSFTVGATSPYSPGYQWLTNGIIATGETGATLTKSAVQLADSGTTFQCVVTNVYGAVTSSVATLAVSATPTLPSVTALNITNYVGNSFAMAPVISGTDPKGGYQWYSNSVALTDDAKHAGTTTAILSIFNAQTSDAGVYSLAVTNVLGAVTNTAATLAIKYAPPAFVQPPNNNYTFVGRDIAFTNKASGYLLTNKWYIATAKGALTPITLGGRFTQVDDASSQPVTSALLISPTTPADATNYVVVVSNPSGSVTSAPVSLALFVQPASHTFGSYIAGHTYSQNFDALPTPGGGSYEAGNPQNMNFVMTNFAAMLTNIPFAATSASTEIDYSIDNPVDFGYPVITNGQIGGFGLSNRMSGWYAWSQNAKKQLFAVTSGDQSAAGIIDHGLNYNNINGYTHETTNRSLGLLTSTASGNMAFGVALINTGTTTNKTVNLSFTGELWRNNPLQQQLLVGYKIDDSGTGSAFPTNDVMYQTLNPISDLTVAFPISVDTLILNGTQVTNQISLSVSNFAIADWKPGSTLWLVWQSSYNAGGAQDVAIDNLVFSTPGAPFITAQPTNQVVVSNSPASFSVSAGGVPPPAYQWLKNGGVNVGTGLASLPFANAMPGDAANYSVVITNDYGSITSSVAKLTVLVPGTTLNVTNSGSGAGAMVNLSWPANQTGWNLQVQTNQLNQGLGTNWINVPNSAGTNAVSLPVNPTNPAVFYRLKF